MKNLLMFFLVAVFLVTLGLFNQEPSESVNASDSAPSVESNLNMDNSEIGVGEEVAIRKRHRRPPPLMH